MKKKTQKYLYLIGMLACLALSSLSARAQTVITNLPFNTADSVTNFSNWFGAQYVTNIWSTNDAATNPASGSLEIVGAFTGGSQQLLVWNGGHNAADDFNPTLDGNAITNLEFDIRFDPTSAVADNGTFGGMAFWTRDANFNPVQLGNYTSIPATTLSWVHFQIPINAIAVPALTNIAAIGFQIHTFGTSMNGTSIMYVDNIKFTGPAVVPTNPPPTMSIAKAKPGLRIFAGDTGNIFSREELATVDQNQSWIGGTYPVSYSFRLLSYPNNIGQTHIFLVPVNSTPGASPYGYNGVDYTATNGLWLTINPAASNTVTAQVSWKTNLPGANPFQAGTVALTITNPTAVGTWTLTFTGTNAGTLTAPGASPAPFTIADENVVADFANPMVAYFGLQPNSTAGEGAFEDWASITVSGVTGANFSDDFTTDSTLNTTIWNNMSQQPASVAVVTTSTPYWVNWTLPAGGFGLGTAMSITGNTNTIDPWMLPEYYNAYADGNIIPSTAQQGLKIWVLVPSTCLPTADGSQGGPLSRNAFFKLFSPPLVN